MRKRINHLNHIDHLSHIDHPIRDFRNTHRGSNDGAHTGRWGGHLLVLLALCLLAAGIGLPLQTETAAAADKPAAVSLTQASKAGDRLMVSWNPVEDCTGYQIQYADNRLFFGKKSVTVKDPAVSSRQISGLSADGSCYVRIRSYRKEETGTVRSAWTLSSNALGETAVDRQILRSGLIKFELRKAIKEKVGGYDTVQGSCYYNGYGYFAMENRNMSVNRIKLVKVRLSDRKVVKVSPAQNLGHGNDLTYDSKRNEIIVAHSTPAPKKLSIVNAKTLMKTYTATVELPDTIKGISNKTLKKYKKNGYYTGFGAVAYNATHDQFVVTLRGEKFHHLMVLDKDFNPIRFIWLDRSKGEMIKQMLQSMDSCGDYIMVAQSYGYGYSGNNIMVYNWAGDCLSRLNLGTSYELESIFHGGGELYASFYTSGYTKITRKLYRRSYIYRLTGY